MVEKGEQGMVAEDSFFEWDQTQVISHFNHGIIRRITVKQFKETVPGQELEKLAELSLAPICFLVCINWLSWPYLTSVKFTSKPAFAPVIQRCAWCALNNTTMGA